MSTSEAVRDALTTDALNSLVHQFSDALCFYRELVQNALDAQSRTIQVELAWEDGVATIAVADQGEGMNRDIIETELTRLFSSSKENDLTKIGKFGVGFVSVFALEPSAVVVDTSRDGENWRVLFHADRSYTLIRLDVPIGGTVVRLLKPMTRRAFEALEEHSATTLSYWCRFSDATITLQGRPINQPFEVDGDLSIRVEEQGTQGVVALTTDPIPFYGFYNRGLTLVEGRQAFFPHVTFRLKSFWLEHTISRDNVMEDDHYRKALAVVREAVYRKLYPRLLQRLREGERALLRFLPGLLRDAETRPAGLWEQGVFATLDGGFMAPRDLVRSRRRHGAVHAAPGPNAVTAALGRQGVPVLLMEDGDVLDACVRATVGDGIQDVRTSLFLPVYEGLSREDRAFERRLDGVVRGVRWPVRRTRLADFDYPGSCIQGELAVLCEHAERPNPAPPLQFPLPPGLGKATLLVNSGHALVRQALAVSRHDPALAVHGLVRVLMLAGCLPPTDGAGLLGRVLKGR